MKTAKGKGKIITPITGVLDVVRVLNEVADEVIPGMVFERSHENPLKEIVVRFTQPVDVKYGDGSYIKSPSGFRFDIECYVREKGKPKYCIQYGTVSKPTSRIKKRTGTRVNRSVDNSFSIPKSAMVTGDNEIAPSVTLIRRDIVSKLNKLIQNRWAVINSYAEAFMRRSVAVSRYDELMANPNFVKLTKSLGNVLFQYNEKTGDLILSYKIEYKTSANNISSYNISSHISMYNFHTNNAKLNFDEAISQARVLGFVDNSWARIYTPAEWEKVNGIINDHLRGVTILDKIIKSILRWAALNTNIPEYKPNKATEELVASN